MRHLGHFVRTQKYVSNYNKPRKTSQLLSPLHPKILDNHCISGHWRLTTEAAAYF